MGLIVILRNKIVIQMVRGAEAFNGLVLQELQPDYLAALAVTSYFDYVCNLEENIRDIVALCAGSPNCSLP